MALRKDEEQGCDDVEVLKAQAHVWDHIFSFISSMSLKCAIELGIPETIHSHGKPMTLPHLIAALRIHPTKAGHLRSLMRLLSHSGFLALREQGYALTDSSRLFLKDNPFNMSPFLLFSLYPLAIEPSECMSTWLQNDDPTAIHTAHGLSTWDFLRQEQNEFGGLFDEAMGSDTRTAASIVVDKCKEMFMGVESLVDVGGGTGAMAKGIADAFPHVECTVLDLPRAVDGLKGTNNLKFLGGDMFHTIPPAHLILLKSILHNWGDEDCGKILKKCKEAILANGDIEKGKVIIIDVVIEDSNRDDKSMETQLLFDVQMMIAVNGKERTEKEWAQLFTDAGFSSYKINSILGIRSLIEVYP